MSDPTNKHSSLILVGKAHLVVLLIAFVVSLILNSYLAERLAKTELQRDVYLILLTNHLKSENATK